MLETLHDTAATIPQIPCDAHCGKNLRTQMYTIWLTRQKITREWVFCSLACLRREMGPVK